MGVVRAELDSISSGQVRQALDKHADLVATGRLRRGSPQRRAYALAGLLTGRRGPYSATPPRRRRRG